jgi:hypothetical protein
LLAVLPWAGLAACFLSPGTARADSLRGTLEYFHSLADSETRTAEAETVRSDVRSFGQRYRLAFDKTLYPYLALRGGGLFERTDSTIETDGVETDSTLTRLNPFAELLLGSPLYNASAGYNRREEKLRSNGEESKLIRDLYSARLGWRPVELPAVNVQYTRTETYDPGREVEDITRETFQVGVRYQPVRAADLTYQGTLNRSENRIGGVEVEDMVHTGRVTYADRFLAGRLTLHANSGLSHRRTEIRAVRGGEVTVPVPAFAGLFARDDTPEEGDLAQEPALVDGNLATSAGIDIGLPAADDPDGSVLRNLGLDLLQPDAEVNEILVWVDRPLTAEVASSFLWAVWVSPNNLDWTLWRTGLPAPFGLFENRFEVRFPTVRTRYVKVVVAPLAPTVVGALDFPEIFVTELQAFLTLPAEQAAREESRTSYLVNVASRARLLDDPILFYDFSLFYTRTEPTSVSRLFLSNGLSLSRRLRPWLTGAAQVARDDVDEPAGERTIYRYGASLAATPMRALSHSAVYSGRTEETEEGTIVRHSLFLNNRAALYRGIDVLLNGGVSEWRREDGAKTRSRLVNFGSEITPHRTMTWSLFYSYDRSERTGGQRPDATVSTRRARAAVSWNPLPAVNFFGSADAVDRPEGRTTLYNWAANWSPFRDGALQISFAYSESLRPEEDGSDRLISPVLRWEMRRGTFLDLSYSLVESKTRAQETETRVVSANLQVNF